MRGSIVHRCTSAAALGRRWAAAAAAEAPAGGKKKGVRARKGGEVAYRVGMKLEELEEQCAEDDGRDLRAEAAQLKLELLWTKDGKVDVGGGQDDQFLAQRKRVAAQRTQEEYDAVARHLGKQLWQKILDHQQKIAAHKPDLKHLSPTVGLLASEGVVSFTVDAAEADRLALRWPAQSRAVELAAQLFDPAPYLGMKKPAMEEAFAADVTAFAQGPYLELLELMLTQPAELGAEVEGRRVHGEGKVTLPAGSTVVLLDANAPALWLMERLQRARLQFETALLSGAPPPTPDLAQLLSPAAALGDEVAGAKLLGGSELGVVAVPKGETAKVPGLRLYSEKVRFSIPLYSAADVHRVLRRTEWGAVLAVSRRGRKMGVQRVLLVDSQPPGEEFAGGSFIPHTVAVTKDLVEAFEKAFEEGEQSTIPRGFKHLPARLHGMVVARVGEHYSPTPNTTLGHLRDYLDHAQTFNEGVPLEIPLWFYSDGVYKITDDEVLMSLSERECRRIVQRVLRKASNAIVTEKGYNKAHRRRVQRDPLNRGAFSVDLPADPARASGDLHAAAAADVAAACAAAPFGWVDGGLPALEALCAERRGSGGSDTLEPFVEWCRRYAEKVGRFRRDVAAAAAAEEVGRGAEALQRHIAEIPFLAVFCGELRTLVQLESGSAQHALAYFRAAQIAARRGVPHAPGPSGGGGGGEPGAPLRAEEVAEAVEQAVRAAERDAELVASAQQGKGWTHDLGCALLLAQHFSLWHRNALRIRGGGGGGGGAAGFATLGGQADRVERSVTELMQHCRAYRMTMVDRYVDTRGIVSSLTQDLSGWEESNWRMRMLAALESSAETAAARPVKRQRRGAHEARRGFQPRHVAAASLVLEFMLETTLPNGVQPFGLASVRVLSVEALGGEGSKTLGVIRVDPSAAAPTLGGAQSTASNFPPMLAPPDSWADEEKWRSSRPQNFRPKGYRAASFFGKMGSPYKTLPGQMLRAAPGSEWITTHVVETARYSLYKSPLVESLDYMGQVGWLISPTAVNHLKWAKRTGAQLGDKLKGGFIPLNPPPPRVMTHASKRRWLEDTDEAAGRIVDRSQSLSMAERVLGTAEAFGPRKLHLPVSVDFRGRTYPMHSTLNYQASDFVRSMLVFSEKKPLGKTGLHHIKIHAANLMGLDKSPLNERLRWCKENEERILKMREDPYADDALWREADKPLLGYVVLCELADALNCSQGSENFESNLPIHVDGSCNGLQHYSAMALDKKGAATANLSERSWDEKPSDIYTTVLEVVKTLNHGLLESETGGPLFEVARLLQPLLKRKTVKQSVMTNVYGVTMSGMTEQVRGQLQAQTELMHDRPNAGMLDRMARHCAQLIQESLSDVFKGAIEIQEWYKDCLVTLQRAHADIKVQIPPISFISPCGVPVIQPYVGQIKFASTHRVGQQAVTLERMVEEGDTDFRKQVTAFPPNYIHSMDASHVHMTCKKLKEKGMMTFGAVHDSYWALPADMDVLNDTLREAFVELYMPNRMEDLYLQLSTTYGRALRMAHTSLPLPPIRGDFDLNEVRRAPYFFA